jgi:tRNA (adenine22-N1)-methyltransferase
MKLGHRLQQLEQMVTQPYDAIWDCCCDHGLLGMSLLQRQAAETIHFVDVVASLTEPLQAKLETYFTQSERQSQHSQWLVHCQDVKTIELNPQLTNLVIIAGVGGDQTLAMLETIIAKNQSQNIEFLLCPVHHLYKLRQAMISLNLGLVNEKIVVENKRYYELIHVSTSSSEMINPVGSSMWNPKRKVDQDYLNKTLKHYQKKAQSGAPFFTQALKTYLQLASQFQTDS